jgi:hypothetical protein
MLYQQLTIVSRRIQNTQFPLWDRIFYKSFVADILKTHVAVPILRIVSQVLDERMQIGLDTEKEVQPKSKSDFLLHFMRIQATNPALPSWLARWSS